MGLVKDCDETATMRLIALSHKHKQNKTHTEVHN